MADMNIIKLNEILEHLIDSREGFIKAANMLTDADDEALSQQLRQRAIERLTLIDAFQSMVKKRGGSAATGGSNAGAVHRLWMDVYAALEEDREAALNTIESGEEWLADTINVVMQQHKLTAETHSLLNQARQQCLSGEAFAETLAT